MKTNNPIISVIIPVCNDAKGLSDTLSSLVNQDYENYEIIVADNGSSDNTLEVTKNFQEKYPDIIEIVIEDKIQSSYAARNKGILSSNGETIAFLDADMIVEKDWLLKIENLFKEKNVDYVGCNVDITRVKKNTYSLYDKITGFPIKDYIEKKHFAPTCCLITKKEVFDNIGLFDNRLISSGDLEFGRRVYAAEKYKMKYAPNIVIRHPARSSFKSLIKKRFRIGRGLFQIYSLYPDYKSNNNSSTNTSTLKTVLNLDRSVDILDRVFLLFIAFVLKVARTMGYFFELIRSKITNNEL